MINPKHPDFILTPVHPERPVYHYQFQGSDTPAVSILTPYYNTDTVFMETVTCLRKQSFQQWEWIIVDDGSTDKAALQRLQEVAESDSRVRLFHQKNQGPSVARNRAAREARTDFLFQIDADDLVEPTFLEKALWFLVSNPNFGFCNAYSIGFGEDNYLWKRSFDLRNAFIDENLVPPPAVIRKKAHEDSGGYDETIRYGHEDWDYWLNLAQVGYWGKTIPEYLVWYRRRSGTRITETMGSQERQEQFVQWIAQKHGKRLADSFPNPQIIKSESYEDLSSEIPFKNLLQKKARRALFILPWLVMGGADKFNLDAVKQLRNRGWEISIATTLPSDNPWVHEFTALTPDVFSLSHFLRTPDYARFLVYLIDSRQIDVVCISNSADAYRLLPLLRAKCPQTAFVDYTHIEEMYWRNGGYPRLAVGYQDLLEKNIVSSNHLREWFVQRGASPEKIEVCYTNIESEEWDPGRYNADEIRKLFNLPKSSVYIFYPARICMQKRPHLFAEIIKRLADQNLDFCAISAGSVEDTQAAAALETLTRHPGVAGHLKILGAVSLEQSKQLQALCRILLLPSLMEGISLAVFEAMAMESVPVIANVGGQGELVTKECGYLISSGAHEIEEYVEAVKKLIQQPDLREKMGREGRKRVASHFEIKTLGDKLDSIFEEVRITNGSKTAALSDRLAKEWSIQAMELRRTEVAAEELDKALSAEARRKKKNRLKMDDPIGRSLLGAENLSALKQAIRLEECMDRIEKKIDLISVVVLFEGADLSKHLNRLYSQSYSTIEVIVVNSGIQTPEKLDYLNSFMQTSGNQTRVFIKPYATVSEAINAGFDRGHGQYNVIVPGTMELHPEYLESCLLGFLLHSGTGFAYAAVRQPDGSVSFAEKDENNPEWAANLPATTMIKAALWKKMKGLDPAQGEKAFAHFMVELVRRKISGLGISEPMTTVRGENSDALETNKKVDL